MDAALHTPEAQPVNRALALLSHYRYMSRGFESSSGFDMLLESVVDSQNKNFYVPLNNLLGQALSRNRVTNSGTIFESFDLVLTILEELADADNALTTSIFRSIQTAEDFHSWLEFIALPAQGWPGISPTLPRVKDTCGRVEAETFLEIGFPIKICRQNGLRLGALINLILDELGNEFESNPRSLSRAIEELRDMLLVGGPGLQSLVLGSQTQQPITSSTSALSLIGIESANAAIPVIIGGAIAVTIRKVIRLATNLARGKIGNLKAVINNQTSLRLDARFAFGVIMYIESRRSAELCREIPGCITFQQAAGINELGSIDERIDQLLGNVLFGVIEPRYITVRDDVRNVPGETLCYVKGTVNGALFEMLLIAYFHALHEIDQDEPPIIGLDVPTNVFLTYQKASGDWAILNRIVRRPDLVLLNEDGPLRERWIEAKSVQAYPSNNSGRREPVLPESSLRNWSQWTFNTSKHNYHRQFYLDWVANTRPNTIKEAQIELPVTQSRIRDQNLFQYSSDYQWYIQDWDLPKRMEFMGRVRGKPITYLRARGFPFIGEDLNELRDEMVKLPVADRKKGYLGSVELTSASSYSQRDQSLRSNRINSFNIGTLVRQNARLDDMFGLPEDVERWFDIFKNLNLERWVGWLDYIPDVVPDFGLNDKINERVNEILAARNIEVCDNGL